MTRVVSIFSPVCSSSCARKNSCTSMIAPAQCSATMRLVMVGAEVVARSVIRESRIPLRSMRATDSPYLHAQRGAHERAHLGERGGDRPHHAVGGLRSEEHTSELQSHSFISYAVFCL